MYFKGSLADIEHHVEKNIAFKKVFLTFLKKYKENDNMQSFLLLSLFEKVGQPTSLLAASVCLTEI